MRSFTSEEEKNYTMAISKAYSKIGINLNNHYFLVYVVFEQSRFSEENKEVVTFSKEKDAIDCQEFMKRAHPENYYSYVAKGISTSPYKETSFLRIRTNEDLSSFEVITYNNYDEYLPEFEDWLSSDKEAFKSKNGALYVKVEVNIKTFNDDKFLRKQAKDILDKHQGEL